MMRAVVSSCREVESDVVGSPPPSPLEGHVCLSVCGSLQLALHSEL